MGNKKRKKDNMVRSVEEFEMLIYMICSEGYRVGLKTGQGKRYYGKITKIDFGRHIWINTKKGSPDKYIFIDDIIRVNSKFIDDIYNRKLLQLMRETKS